METNQRIKGIILLSFLIPIISFSQTKREVYSYICNIGIEHPEIVYAQAQLESANFTSNVYQTKNNMFGFRYKKKYLYFRDWKHCIRYYKKWQDKYYKGGDYFDFLNCIWKHKNGDCVTYASDEDYIYKLKQLNK